MMSIYQPDTSLKAKVKRRLVPFQARRTLKLKLEQPIVSFSFDDCPKSVLENAIKPMAQENWRSTVYISMGLCGTTNHLGLHMNSDDVQALHTDGHEIGDHTFSHIDATQHSVEQVMADIDKNQASLDALGLPFSEGFAYPYGQVTTALKATLSTKFKGARGIRSAVHDTTVDLNQIASNRLYAGSDFEKLMHQIESLKTNPAWLPIFTHDVRENPSHYGCTPKQMKTVIQAVKDVGAKVLTMADAIDYLETNYAT